MNTSALVQQGEIMMGTRKVYADPYQPTGRPLLESVESKVADATKDPKAWTEVDDLLRRSQPGVHEDMHTLNKYTTLQLAAKYGRLEALSFLLKRNDLSFVQDIEEKDERGQTALHLAARGGHHEIAKELIEFCKLHNPASVEGFVNLQSHFDTYELHEDSKKAVSKDIRSRYRMYTQRLPYERRKSSEKNVQRTALHEASAGGHWKTVKYLLSIPEVHASSTDSEGNTALHLAIPENYTNRLGVLKELLRAPNIDVNLKGNLGDTPLHVAVRKGNMNAVELLCKRNRLIGTKRNDNEMTPLRLAWELRKSGKSNPDTLQMMRSMLLVREDVKIEEENLKSEREVLYMAVNALLVGATLLASVTFAGILEMPVLPPNENFIQLTKPTELLDGALIPSQEHDPEKRQRLYVRVIDLFRGSNNMCFFLALISLMLAIQVPISRRHKKVNIYVEEEVEHLRTRSVLVSFCLTLSTFCAGVAFVTGGLAKVPVSESGWSSVISHWMRGKEKLLFQSTMLTTNLSMGCILFLILMYTVIMDYRFILRYQFERFSWPSLGTFLFSVLLFVLLTVVIFLLIFGSGLL